MPVDARVRLRQAHQDYAAAIERRDGSEPSQPGYHEAVLEVGIRWSQVRYWERRAVAQETQAALSAGSPPVVRG